MKYISDIFNGPNKERIHKTDVKLLFINASIGYRLNLPYALSYRAFSYYTTQRHDSTLQLRLSSLSLDINDFC